MCQAELNNSDILSIEKETANKVNFNAIIKEFAQVKVRRQKNYLIFLFALNKELFSVYECFW